MSKWEQLLWSFAPTPWSSEIGWCPEACYCLWRDTSHGHRHIHTNIISTGKQFCGWFCALCDHSSGIVSRGQLTDVHLGQTRLGTAPSLVFLPVSRNIFSVTQEFVGHWSAHRLYSGTLISMIFIGILMSQWGIHHPLGDPYKLQVDVGLGPGYQRCPAPPDPQISEVCVPQHFLLYLSLDSTQIKRDEELDKASVSGVPWALVRLCKCQNQKHLRSDSVQVLHFGLFWFCTGVVSIGEFLVFHLGELQLRESVCFPCHLCPLSLFFFLNFI